MAAKKRVVTPRKGAGPQVSAPEQAVASVESPAPDETVESNADEAMGEHSSDPEAEPSEEGAAAAAPVDEPPEQLADAETSGPPSTDLGGGRSEDARGDDFDDGADLDDSADLDAVLGSGPELSGEGLDAPEGEVESTEEFLKGLVEAILFAADRPLTAKEVARAARIDRRRAEELLDTLVVETRTRGMRLTAIADGFGFRTHPSYSAYVREFLAQRPVRLSRAQLETLAIIAYRQPVTRPEVDDIRGVDSGAVIKTLLERELVRILGKKDEPGRPMIYGTTPQFLDLFSLKSLRDLPTLREFTELSEDSRAKFELEIGEPAPEGPISFESEAPASSDGDAAEPDESDSGEPEPDEHEAGLASDAPDSGDGDDSESDQESEGDSGEDGDGPDDDDEDDDDDSDEDDDDSDDDDDEDDDDDSDEDEDDSDDEDDEDDEDDDDDDDDDDEDDEDDEDDDDSDDDEDDEDDDDDEKS